VVAIAGNPKAISSTDGLFGVWFLMWRILSLLERCLREQQTPRVRRFFSTYNDPQLSVIAQNNMMQDCITEASQRTTEIR
jgi:hypothetical protein